MVWSVPTSRLSFTESQNGEYFSSGTLTWRWEKTQFFHLNFPQIFITHYFACFLYAQIAYLFVTKYVYILMYIYLFVCLFIVYLALYVVYLSCILNCMLGCTFFCMFFPVFLNCLYFAWFSRFPSWIKIFFAEIVNHFLAFFFRIIKITVLCIKIFICFLWWNFPYVFLSFLIFAFLF